MNVGGSSRELLYVVANAIASAHGTGNAWTDFTEEAKAAIGAVQAVTSVPLGDTIKPQIREVLRFKRR